nr:MAG TPA: hypothetical protein [Caudoviricetes sp.]
MILSNFCLFGLTPKNFLMPRYNLPPRQFC